MQFLLTFKPQASPQKIPWMIQVSFALAPAPHKRQTICSWPFLEATCSNKRLVVSIWCSAWGSSSQRTSTMSPFPHNTCGFAVLSQRQIVQSNHNIMTRWNSLDSEPAPKLPKIIRTSKMKVPNTCQKWVSIMKYMYIVLLHNNLYMYLRRGDESQNY